MSRPGRAGLYEHVMGRDITAALADPTRDIVPSFEVLLALAQLPPPGPLEALVAFARTRLMVGSPVHQLVSLSRAQGGKYEMAAAVRLEKALEELPERDVRIRPDAEVESQTLMRAGATKLSELEPAHVPDHLAQIQIVKYGVQPAVAISQRTTILKALPKQILGVHHLLMYLARITPGSDHEQAWSYAMALMNVTPPLPFFCRQLGAGPVSNDIRAAALAYAGGADEAEF